MGASFDVYDSFINDDEEVISKSDPNEEGYQRPLDYPEIYEIIDNSDGKMSANSHDQYIGDEVVLPDQKGDKLMGKVRKRVRYDDPSEGEGDYNSMYDKSFYEVEYPDGTTEQLAFHQDIQLHRKTCHT